MVKLISKENLDFLNRHNKDIGIDLTRIATSESQLGVGDVILFNYFGEGYNGASRLGLVVRPVVAQAGTGNRLLSVVNIPPSTSLSPKVVDNLYKNRGSLDSEGYRTFILNNKVKNIMRIEPFSSWLQEEYDNLEEEFK